MAVHWIVQEIERERKAQGVTGAELIRANHAEAPNPSRDWRRYREGDYSLPSLRTLEAALSRLGKKLVIVDKEAAR